MTHNDQDRDKGAVEQEDPKQSGNTNFRGQLGHRGTDPMVKGYDTDFPEPGENEEHSGEPNDVRRKKQEDAA